MGEIYSFNATESEEEFLETEVKRSRTSISAVIKRLIWEAIREKGLGKRMEKLEAKLEGLKKIGLFAAESAVYAGHIAQANYIELAEEDQANIDETKKYAAELTEKEMKKIQ